MTYSFRPILFAPFLLATSALAQATPPATQTTPPTQTTTSPAASAPPSAGALPDSPDTVKPALEPTGPTAVFDTSMGRMTCRLRSKEAPGTVANFIALAGAPRTEPTRRRTETAREAARLCSKNGITFQRIIPGFMIQGGDPVGDGGATPLHVPQRSGSQVVRQQSNAPTLRAKRYTRRCRTTATP